MGSPVRSWVCQTTLSAATSGCLREEFEGVDCWRWDRLSGRRTLADSMADFCFLAEAAIDDGQRIVGGEVVGIDGLEPFVDSPRAWA